MSNPVTESTILKRTKNLAILWEIVENGLKMGGGGLKKRASVWKEKGDDLPTFYQNHLQTSVWEEAAKWIGSWIVESWCSGGGPLTCHGPIRFHANCWWSRHSYFEWQSFSSAVGLIGRRATTLTSLWHSLKISILAKRPSGIIT